MFGSKRQPSEEPGGRNIVQSASGNFKVAISDLEKLALDQGVEVGSNVGRYRVTALARDSETDEPMVVYTDGRATWVRPLRLWRKS